MGPDPTREPRIALPPEAMLFPFDEMVGSKEAPLCLLLGR
jgi:hypothetical protein